VIETSSYHERALALHRRVRVVDAHCDTISLVLDEGHDLVGGDARHQVDVPRLRAAGVGIQVLACWNEPEHSGHAAYARCMAKIGTFHQLVRRAGLRPVTRKADLDVPELGFILSLEDAAPAMGSLRHLETLHVAGVRMIGLTWNGRNELADGVGVGPRPGGLTDLGRAFVEEMEVLGIVVDLAHVSEPCFWDVIELATKPVAVSHANAKALCDHRRNLTDDQIRAVAKTGGVIGVTYVPSFLGGDEPDVDTVVRHVEHMISVAGPSVVGLGSDFDGIAKTPVGLEHAGCLPALTAALLARGHAEADVEAMVGGNWLRVFRACWRD
jgi:membrane dipeptidase